jgi:hypothetical protein
MDYLCSKRLQIIILKDVQIIMRIICAQANNVCAKLKTWYPINWLHKIIILNSKLPPELSPHSKRFSMSSQVLTFMKGPILGVQERWWNVNTYPLFKATLWVKMGSGNHCVVGKAPWLGHYPNKGPWGGSQGCSWISVMAQSMGFMKFGQALKKKFWFVYDKSTDIFDKHFWQLKLQDDWVYLYNGWVHEAWGNWSFDMRLNNCFNTSWTFRQTLKP